MNSSLAVAWYRHPTAQVTFFWVPELFAVKVTSLSRLETEREREISGVVVRGTTLGEGSRKLYLRLLKVPKQ
jgi:hypothetical protein